MALIPTRAQYPSPELAIHGIPAKEIIPAFRALALANSRHLYRNINTELSTPFICTAADSADQFIYTFRKLVGVLASNGQPIPDFQLRDYFCDAVNANYRDLLSPYLAYAAANKAVPDWKDYIEAFLSAKPALQDWLTLQSHAPAALAAAAATATSAVVSPTAPAAQPHQHYCWSHGSPRNNSHPSHKCPNPNPGHQNKCTKSNRASFPGHYVHVKKAAT
jgi:hypothetical protein